MGTSALISHVVGLGLGASVLLGLGLFAVGALGAIYALERFSDGGAKKASEKARAEWIKKFAELPER